MHDDRRNDFRLPIKLALAVGAFLLTFPCFSQSVKTMELGVSGSGSFFTSKDVTNATGQADATFTKGFGLSVWVGNDMHEHLSGDVRYTFANNSPKLEMGGQSASFSGDSHTIEYDLLIHVTRRESDVRPYFLVGGGGRYFRGTGAEQAFQPLQDFALLTKTSEWVPTAAFGGGVMFRMSPKLMLRAEFRDYVSPVPDKIIQPAPGARLSGWVHNFMPSFGLSYRF